MNDKKPDPVEEYAQSKRGKEALAYQLGKFFDKEEEPTPPLISSTRNDEFRDMLIAVIPALKDGRVEVIDESFGPVIRLNLPIKLGFQHGSVQIPTSHEQRFINELIDRLHDGAIKELGLERRFERAREQGKREGDREGYQRGYDAASSRQAGQILLDKLAAAEDSLRAVRAAGSVQP